MTYTPAMGMTFWREFDRATQYSTPFLALAGSAGAFGVQDDFRAARDAGTYPDALAVKFAPVKDLWEQIAEVQSSAVATHLGSDPSHLQGAFEDFGQGILVDTDPQRVADRNWVHMMDTGRVEPVGYHRWHASIRVTQLLGIGDSAWWEELDRQLGLAWAIQSRLRPRQQPSGNPPIDPAVLQQLRNAWLPLSPGARDRQFGATSGPTGYHPSPTMPV